MINHVSIEAQTAGCMGLIVHQQRYRPSNGNRNVDVLLSVHNTFLE